MKLVHPDLNQQLEFREEKACEWIIESPVLFSKYVVELQHQIEGEDGQFVLSEQEKALDIAKCVEIIVNPLDVNINEKKVVNKLYLELEELASGETMFLKTQEILAKLQEYFGEMEQNSAYALSVAENIEISSLFKAVEVKLESYAEDWFENLNQYMRVLAEFLRRKIIVFVNIRSYISDKQLIQLLENAAYNEIKLLLIESSQRSFSEGTKRYIIDYDGCEI